MDEFAGMTRVAFDLSGAELNSSLKLMLSVFDDIPEVGSYLKPLNPKIFGNWSYLSKWPYIKKIFIASLFVVT